MSKPRATTTLAGGVINVRFHPHWFVLAQPFIVLVLAAVFGVSMIWWAQSEQVDATISETQDAIMPGDKTGDAFVSKIFDLHNLGLGPWITWLGAIILLVASGYFLWKYLERSYTEYAIAVGTNYTAELIKVVGLPIFEKTGVSIPLDKINNLEIKKPLAGSLFGWGHIDIQTGNDYKGDNMPYMPDPDDFVKAYRLLESEGYGRGDTSGVRGGGFDNNMNSYNQGTGQERGYRHMDTRNNYPPREIDPYREPVWGYPPGDTTNYLDRDPDDDRTFRRY